MVLFLYVEAFKRLNCKIKEAVCNIQKMLVNNDTCGY